MSETFVPETWHGELLRRGSHGVRVVQIQQRLKARGWNIGIDGEFGRATYNVVVMFQREKGLKDDGIIGRTTWDAMYAFQEGADTTVPPPTPVPDPPPPAGHGNPAGQCAAWGFDGNAGKNPVREFQRAFAWWTLSVDGDAGPETAKAVQKVVDEGGKLSPHFNMSELACKHCGRIRYLRAQLERLEALRSIVGAVHIVSGYRCPDHNAAIGSGRNSQHPMGAAADIRVSQGDAERAGFVGIGLCNGEAYHGDSRDESGNNTTGASPGNITFWFYC